MSYKYYLNYLRYFVAGTLGLALILACWYTGLDWFTPSDQDSIAPFQVTHGDDVLDFKVAPVPGE